LPFALRFLLATNPEALARVLGIIYRTISGHVLRKARLTRAAGATGAVTLIQRFGSALNLNVAEPTKEWDTKYGNPRTFFLDRVYKSLSQ
jgi:hypothetical protein